MSEKIVELPTNIYNVECVTECWTYNRLIVLKTSPYYEDWIASHYSLYTTNQYNFRFGETWMYTPEYYDAILKSKPVHLFELTESNIIDRLKAELLNGYYLNMMIKPCKEKDLIHEVVVCGYDDYKQVFRIIRRENRIFQNQEYSYEYMKEILPEIQENFQNKKQRGMELSVQYQSPIYAFKLREDFPTENCAFHAYRKLINELEGTCFDDGKMNDTWVFKVCARVYRGISCLNALVDMINKVMAGEEMEPGFQGMTSAARKLYEHRRMIIISMRYILRKWETAMKPQTEMCISNYFECSLRVGKWVNMMIKFELTRNEDILKRIIAEVPEIYEKEYNALNKFVNDCIDWDKFNQYYI